MPERFFDDDKRYIAHSDERYNNASSWIIPLLLLPIAFLAGWVTNGFVADEQFNRMVPGIETGVGGGPDDGGQLISPLPTERIDISPTSQQPTPTIAPTGIEEESLVE